MRCLPDADLICVFFSGTKILFLYRSELSVCTVAGMSAGVSSREKCLWRAVSFRSDPANAAFLVGVRTGVVYGYV